MPAPLPLLLRFGPKRNHWLTSRADFQPLGEGNCGPSATKTKSGEKQVTGFGSRVHVKCPPSLINKSLKLLYFSLIAIFDGQ